MRKDRSGKGIIRSAVDVKSWLAETPDVSAVRPSHCPFCDAPSRPPGGALGLWGHGLRGRQQRGPLGADDTPVTVTVEARRYLCVHCDGVCLVVPRSVAPRRHYARAAIALALTLYGLCGEPVREVRRRTSPWRVVGDTAQGGWVTLRRWIAAARRGGLLAGVPGWSDAATPRQIAERVAQRLVALAPPSARGLDLAAQAFLGGASMA